MLTLLLAIAEPLLVQPGATIQVTQATGPEDQQICDQLSAVAEKFMAEVPKMVDAVTRVDGLAVYCATHTVTTSKYILLDLKDMKDDWRTIKQSQLNDQDCNARSSRALIDLGWSFKQIFTFKSGERFILTANCD